MNCIVLVLSAVADRYNHQATLSACGLVAAQPLIVVAVTLGTQLATVDDVVLHISRASPDRVLVEPELVHNISMFGDAMDTVRVRAQTSFLPNSK
jgi:hypothetical protein